MGASVQRDHAIFTILLPQEDHISRYLHDLEARMEKSARGAVEKAPRLGIDVLRFRRIIHMCLQVFLPGSGPWLIGNLSIRWIDHAAGLRNADLTGPHLQ